MQKNPIDIKTRNEYCFANLLSVSIIATTCHPERSRRKVVV